MKNLIDQLNESLGVNNPVNEANHKTSSNDKDVRWPLTPAQDYMGEFGVIIGNVWNINHKNQRIEALNLIKSLGLHVENDIDDILGMGDDFVDDQWNNGYNFVYFLGIDGSVNAYVFDSVGVEVIK